MRDETITFSFADLLISGFGYAHPVRLYSICRADIGFDQRKSRGTQKSILIEQGELRARELSDR
jgi:hypothetical protein